MASIGRKSVSRTSESRSVSKGSWKQPNSRSRTRVGAKTLEQFHKDAKAYQAKLHAKHFKAGES